MSLDLLNARAKAAQQLDDLGGRLQRRAGVERRLGAEAVQERVVFDGKLVTAAGVSAGIDMALSLAARIAGETVAQAIQLGIEYDPQPPFDAGSPLKAPAAVVELLRGRSRFEEHGQEALAAPR